MSSRTGVLRSGSTGQNKWDGPMHNWSTSNMILGPDQNHFLKDIQKQTQQACTNPGKPCLLPLVCGLVAGFASTAVHLVAPWNMLHANMWWGGDHALYGLKVLTRPSNSAQHQTKKSKKKVMQIWSNSSSLEWSVLTPDHIKPHPRPPKT